MCMLTPKVTETKRLSCYGPGKATLVTAALKRLHEIGATK